MNLPTHKKESGTAIVLVISVLITLVVIIGVAVDYTTTISRHVQRSDTLGSAIAIGDGCIENMFTYWREACRAQPNKVLTTNDLASLQLPQALQFPNVPNFTATPAAYDATKTVSNCQVIAVDPEWNTIDPSAPPPPGVGQQAGTQTYNYLATAYVTLPALRGNLVAKVQRVLQKEQISPWNWAIFYLDPLEIHPGAPFNVTGWVHTNSNLYTGGSGGNPNTNYLHFMDKVTYGSDWSIDYAPGDSRKGTVTPQSPTWPANMPPALDAQHQPFGIDSGSFKSSNPNNDDFHTLIEPPVSGQSDPNFGSKPTQRYFLQASVAISIDNSSNVTIGTPNSDGTITKFATSNPLYTMFNGALTPNDATIQDNRELGAQVRVTTLDVNKLISSGNWKAAGFNSNAVVYINDTSAASSNGNPATTPSVTQRRAIRIKNGASIPAGGLTVASGNPVYLQGDFNTGMVDTVPKDGSAGTPPSNYTSGNDPTKPQVTGYTRQPCSIVGDAVYILSNAWQDSNSGLDVTARVASNTTVNAAIVSGIVPTNYNNNGIYSGGAENFPRFNETWSNKTLTYYGSMVELYTSEEATGNWGNSNVYVPPKRQWYFDNNFKTSSPPGSMMIYNYIKGKWSLL